MFKDDGEKKHSCYSYLCRQTTEKLDAMLVMYLREEPSEYNKGLVMMITHILKEREKGTEYEVSPAILALYESKYGKME